MKYIQKEKACKCSRTNEHEHKTMQQYIIKEVNSEYTCELYEHGYDFEDDHIYEMIRELKIDNPKSYFTVKLLKSKNI